MRILVEVSNIVRFLIRVFWPSQTNEKDKAMTQAPYVDRGGEQVFQQPFVAKNVLFNGFLLEANLVQLKILCDKYLNTPSGGKTAFEPAWPFVLLAFCDLKSLVSTTPPYNNWGWFSEKEAAIWLLMVDKNRERMFWFHPYIFVDNAYALTMGRELYGFPKGLGYFELPSDPENSDYFSMDTLVLKEFSTQTQGTKEKFMEARRVAKSGKPPSPWGSALEMMKDLIQTVEHQSNIFKNLRLAFDTADDLLHGRAPMVFLKQFRDVTNPAQACYQSIVEAPSKMLGFSKGSLLHDEYEITLHEYASHPINSELGLKAGPLKSLLSFQVEFDFEIGNGTEIWRAS